MTSIRHVSILLYLSRAKEFSFSVIRLHRSNQVLLNKLTFVRLFIVLEKAISTASKFQLFELNDEFTRAMFRNMTEPFLRDVKGRRGITDFLVVCDETNNTGEVIDTNRFVADIYIKPARSINFISLNFIAHSYWCGVF